MRVICSLVVLLYAADMPASEWPRFRGPAGAGIAEKAALPEQFGPETNLVWKAAIGPGHSSPVLCGGQLYLTSFTEKSLHVHAIDAQTGRPLWQRDLPRDRQAKGNKLNNAASPSPVCDSRGVVAFFADFGLAAYTTAGKSVWTRPTPAVVNNHGMASSPVLAGDRLIQVLSGDQGSDVLAVDRKSGRELWREKLIGVTYATPAITPDRQVLVLSTGELVSLDQQTGKRRWWWTGIPYQPKSSPVLSADGATVYVSIISIGEGIRNALSSFDKLLAEFDANSDSMITQEEFRKQAGWAGGFPQLDLDGNGFFTRKEQEEIYRLSELPHTVAAIPTDGAGDQSKRVLWKLHKGVPTVSTPLLHGGIVYLFKEGGILTSVRAADGVVLKEGRIQAGFGSLYSSPIFAAGRMYVANEQGKLFVLKAGPDWTLLSTNDLGEEVYATPVVTADRLYIRSRNILWCFGSQP